MDICIDTEEVTDGMYSITNIINRLEGCIGFIKSKLASAGEEFTSINYERTSNSVNKATNALDKMNAKLEMTKKYLNTLVEHIERYNKLTF